MIMLRATDDNSANSNSAKAACLIRTRTIRPLEVRRHFGVVAVTLVCCGLVVAACKSPEDRPSRIGGIAPAIAAPELVTSSDHALRTFQRFAINALVFPLIDDTEPPRWTRHATDWICDGRGEVAIDGKPLVEGEPVPIGVFSVRWNLQRCPPLSGAELLIDGEIALTVSHEGTDLHAHIAAPTLWVETPAGRRRLPAAAAAHDNSTQWDSAEAAQ